MRIGKAAIWLAVSALPLASVASAQDRAGNQVFRIPQGWLRTDTPGTTNTTLTPASEPKNLVVILLSGRIMTGDFRDTFNQEVERLNGTLRTLRSTQVQSRRTPQGVEMLAVSLELEVPGGTPSKRYYMAASVGGRYESLTYMAVTPDLYQRFWPDVLKVVSSWAFANPGPASTSSPSGTTAQPPANPGTRLEGVYSGYKFIYTTVLGVVQKKAVNDYFSFFADGTVYWGLPQAGLAGFNMARECRGQLEYCGNYQVSGSQLVIVLNRGTYRQTGTIGSGMLQIGDRQYTLQGDISKSTARFLDGDFMRADARPGEDLARRFIRFTRDGRFLDQGIVTTVVSSDISTGNPVFERASGTGTYALGPYSIILRYADGYQRQLGVVVPPTDMEKPVHNQLLVNTYTLVRRR